MKRFTRAIKITFLINFSLFLIGTVIYFSIFSFKDLFNDSSDILRYIYSFLVFFIPSSLAVYSFYNQEYKKRDKILIFIIVGFLIFSIHYSIFYFHIAQLNLREIPFLNLGSVFNGVIAYFVYLFTFLVIFLKKNTRKKRQKNSDIQLKKWSFIKIFIAISILYYVVLYVLSGMKNSKYDVRQLAIIFSLGILVFAFTQYLFTSKKLNTTLKVFFYYIIILSFVSILIPYLYTWNFISFRYFIQVLVIFGPYYLFLMLGVHSYYLYEINKSDKKILKQQSLESQLNYQQLKNQISPHFLFNNINVLTSLIEENPKKAVSFSENLSHIYRYFLEQEKQDVVLVKEEIKFAKSYLELLQDRFEVGFRFLISVDETAKEKYIVSTILQQVLENVVKHNTINAENKVAIKITNENNYLTITNNKNPKLETTDTSKKGIENIKKRIAFFTDKKVMIENNEKHYVIKLPILETV